MSEVDNSNFFKVDWASRSQLRGPGERSLGGLLLKLRNKLMPEAEGLSITYLDNRAMRKLNREHRNINHPTDVLSFPANPEKGAFQYLGDIIISLPVAEKMSKKLGVSRRREVETLVIHGFLHLCMYDHETDNGEMMALQAKLERDLLGSEPLVMTTKRGRKLGSKVKCLKDGSHIVVTGRAASAAIHKEAMQASKYMRKFSKNLNGAPENPTCCQVNTKKTPEYEVVSVRRTVRRKHAHNLRNGVLG
jgi:probable rRNA maturation factor